MLQHAPLHYVILHARFVLVYGYMIIYSGDFLFLDILAFALRPFHFSFSKSIELANVVKFLDTFPIIHISALTSLFSRCVDS